MGSVNGHWRQAERTRVNECNGGSIVISMSVCVSVCVFVCVCLSVCEDMITDRQTDRQTDTLITILCSYIGDRVISSAAISVTNFPVLVAIEC